jgi:TolB-like protein/Tfp pilus assembly protein PilF
LIPVQIDASSPPLGFGQVQSITIADSRERDAALAELAGAVRRLTSGDVAQATTTRAMPRKRSWRLLGAGMALLIAVASAAYLVTRLSSRAPSTPERSVAVLPFTGSSETQDHAYLGDGIAAEIISQLSRVPGLHVPARTSSFSFKGKQMTVREIAQELGVTQVLEGSVQVNGNRLRVTTQLIRADTGYQLWSERYDRELRDVFAVQDDIAQTVAQSLRLHVAIGSLTPRQGGTQNLEAYQLYLQAWREMDKNTPEANKAAEEYLNRAVQLDPSYGLAWVALASLEIAKEDRNLVPETEGYERARELANHALQVSPDVAGAYQMLSWVAMALDWDWAAAESLARRAFELDPSDAGTLFQLGYLAMILGDDEAAVRHVRDAVARDPRNPWLIFNEGSIYYHLGRFEAADEMFLRTLEIEPEFSWAIYRHIQSLALQDKPDAAFAMFQRTTDERLRRGAFPIVMHALGRQEEANRALEDLIAQFSDDAAYAIASIAAFLGKHDLALEWLERAYQQRDGEMYYVGCEPMLANVADDPRYEALLRKMNLPRVTRRRRD